MSMPLVAHVLWLRRRLRWRERWSQTELRAQQQGALADMCAYATARSPFYEQFHRNLERAPLSALPVLTKTLLWTT